MTSAFDIATRLHLRAVPGRREWRGACPACGYTASFAVKEKDGRAVWWCASCGNDREALSVAVRKALGWDRAPPAPCPCSNQSNAVSEAKTARASALRDAALPLPGTVATRYLTHRGLTGVTSPALRFHPACWHPGGTKLPAMLALVRNALTGEPQAIHRTFLHRDGAGKAAVEPQKASLGPVAGGVVMLEKPRQDAPLVIGEGIESALSAGLLIGAPAWSAISAGNMAVLDLPTDIRSIIVAADPDEPGQRAACQAASRWRAEGRHVRIATLDAPSEDFNDLWRRRTALEAVYAR
ncbi:MAG: toprim domain-containing protein [Acetobacteraceae bacterium]|nr:toprim domain-containing protein [Acetobacteraceae bacterium]